LEEAYHPDRGGKYDPGAHKSSFPDSDSSAAVKSAHSDHPESIKLLQMNDDYAADFFRHCKSLVNFFLSAGESRSRFLA